MAACSQQSATAIFLARVPAVLAIPRSNTVVVVKLTIVKIPDQSLIEQRFRRQHLAGIAAFEADCAFHPVFFGCGGDRDRAKRKVMGEIAEKFADKAYVTDDNPRSEFPIEIRREIMKGCPKGIDAGERAGAIRRAVLEMEEGDILLVAGKGHEQGQTIGDTVYEFDDVTVVRSAIVAAEQQNNLETRRAN